MAIRTLQSEVCKQIKCHSAPKRGDSDRSNSQRHVASCSPNLAACGPWVFSAVAEGTLEAGKKKTTQVPVRSHTLAGRGDDRSQICGRGEK